MEFLTSALLGGLVYDAVKVFGGKVTDVALERLYHKHLRAKIDGQITAQLAEELNTIDYSQADSADDIANLIKTNKKIETLLDKINETSQSNDITIHGDVHGDVIGSVGGDYIKGDKSQGDLYKNCNFK